jgi:hypothetical protein
MSHVDAVRAAYGVEHIVIGHTPTLGAVMPRLGGKVICIDVGLSKHYGYSPACLLIEKGRYYAIHRASRLDLPMSSSGIPQYLKAAAALDPPGTNLRKFVESGGAVPNAEADPE